MMLRSKQFVSLLLTSVCLLIVFRLQDYKLDILDTGKNRQLNIIINTWKRILLLMKSKLITKHLTVNTVYLSTCLE